METIDTKIKFTVEDEFLQVLIALSAEFVDCGKISDILLSTQTTRKNIKLTDQDFICVYKGLLKALKSTRYPHKTGNEYKTLMELKEFFEALYLQQRNIEIHL